METSHARLIVECLQKLKEVNELQATTNRYSVYVERPDKVHDAVEVMRQFHLHALQRIISNISPEK